MKPLSNNRMWQGRRFKTKDYLAYEEEVGWLLPRHKQVKGFVYIEYDFFLKNFGLRDVDNMIKPLQDILVKNGLIEDDRFIISFKATKWKAKKDSVMVHITPYGNYHRKHWGSEAGAFLPDEQIR